MGERVREPPRGAMQGVMLAVTDAATPEHELKVHTVTGTGIPCPFKGRGCHGVRINIESVGERNDCRVARWLVTASAIWL